MDCIQGDVYVKRVCAEIKVDRRKLKRREMQKLYRSKQRKEEDLFYAKLSKIKIILIKFSVF